jgi:GNAT superfamily N-acetyltransferase
LAARVIPPPASALLRDLRCLCRRDGVKVTAQKMARAALRAVHSSTVEVVLVKRLDEPSSPPPDDGALRIEPLGPQHAGALAELNRRRCFTRKDLRYAEWLARGYRGFAIYAEDEPAGLIWWIDRRIEPAHPEVEHLGIELDDRDVYSFDYYLAEQHRGQGNAVAAFHRVECALADLGYRRLWGYVLAENRPARWIYAIRGFEDGDRVSIRRVLFWRTSTRSTSQDRG